MRRGVLGFNIDAIPRDATAEPEQWVCSNSPQSQAAK